MCAEQRACSTGLAEAEGTAEMTKPEANVTSLCGISNWFLALRSHCRAVGVLQGGIGQVVEKNGLVTRTAAFISRLLLLVLRPPLRLLLPLLL